MRRRSIRSSLLIGAVGGILLILAAAGVILDQAAHRSMVLQVDRDLRGKAQLLASTIEVTHAGIQSDFDDLDMREFESTSDATYLSLTVADGVTLYRSPEFPASDVPVVETPLGRPQHRTIRLSDGRTLRAVDLAFLPKLDLGEDDDEDDSRETTAYPTRASSADPHTMVAPVVTLFLARDLSTIDALLARMRIGLALVGLATGIAAVGIIGAVVRRSLHPLDELASEIEGVDENRLSNRIRLERAPAEIEPVVDRLNELLSQLEVAFQRERTLTADIAHELRTPLAGLRTTLEVELARTRTVEEYQEALRTALEIGCRMQDMVQTLLQLSRLEAGQIHVEERSLDLAELTRASWESLVATAVERRLRVDWVVASDVSVVTDPALVESAVRNVLENAVSHAEAGGYLRIELESGEDGRANLRVVNSGSSVAQEQVPHLFERFFRLDEARDASRGHFGLGLAIVKRISDLLSIPLDIHTRVGGEFSVVLSFRRAH